MLAATYFHQEKKAGMNSKHGYLKRGQCTYYQVAADIRGQDTTDTFSITSLIFTKYLNISIKVQNKTKKIITTFKHYSKGQCNQGGENEMFGDVMIPWKIKENQVTSY